MKKFLKERSRSVSPLDSPTLKKTRVEVDGRDDKWSILCSDWVQLHNKSVIARFPTEKLIHQCTHFADDIHYVKIAAFDMDDTLIMPPSGAVFAKDDPKDWKFIHPHVSSHLKMLFENHYLVTIFTNQSAIFKAGSWNEKKASVIKDKLLLLSERLGIPLVSLISTRDDWYRKPGIGMWHVLQDYLRAKLFPKGGNEQIDFQSCSFYVGDAAGRSLKTLAGRKKDFSCSDRKFAHNLSLPFLTPEELFLSSSSKLLVPAPNSSTEKVLNPELIGSSTSAKAGTSFDWRGIGPSDLASLPTSYESLKFPSTSISKGSTLITHKDFTRDQQEMVMFVGFPACGKSTFYRRFFKDKGYTHINRDEMKTIERCLKKAETDFKSGKSVVIDNTNSTTAERMKFINIVKTNYKGSPPLPVRIFHFTHSLEMAMHMNVVRSRAGVAPSIPAVAYNVFKSKYKPVDASTLSAEGVSEVICIPPVALFDSLPSEVQKNFYILS